jgi:hypothetical protein
MAAQRVGDPPGTAAPSSAHRDHPWRVVLLVLLALVVGLGALAVVLVAAGSGLVADVWTAMTSVFHQP